MESSNTFQLINDQLDWCPGLTKHLESMKTIVNSNNYKAIAVMGAQSTGKSTILNFLFGTKFQVMDSTANRSQTTRGIFAQPTPGGSVADPFLIFDVEGTDSEEREDYGSKFEKMLCTFALVVADVLIINMFTTDVGRSKGSSMKLLKTILQVNVKLFKTEIKPKNVIILLRDFSDEENLVEIDRKFKKSLQAFLDTIETEQEVSLQEVIQYKLITMPHIKFQKDNFSKKIKEIQQKFKDGDLFPQSNPYIPLNGMEKYLESIWTKIKSDETLDIPSEQALVSNYLCEKAFIESSTAFESNINLLERECDKRLFGEEFSKYYSLVQNGLLEKYRDLTKYLDKNISQKIEVKLTQEINQKFENYSSRQIELLTQSIEKEAQTDTWSCQNFQTIEKIWDHFEQTKTNLLDQFQKEIKFYKLKGEYARDYEKKQISSRIAEVQAPQMHKVLQEFENKRIIEDKKREEQRIQEEKQREDERKKEQLQIQEEHKKELEIKEEDIEKMRSKHYVPTSTGNYAPYSGGFSGPLETISEYNPRQGNQNTNSANYVSFLSDLESPQRTYSARYSTSYSTSMSGPLKNDGTPDMRYSANRTALKSNGHQYNLNGSIDRRYKGGGGPLKKDGTPDMRYKANRR